MSDSATLAYGSAVDDSILRLEIAYDTQGNAYQFTSLDAVTSGSVVNQVQRAFNGLGQLTAEYQNHSGSVNTSTAPAVQYSYSEMSGSANHSRLTSVIYPDTFTVNYQYANGLDANISRLTRLVSGSTTLEEFQLESFRRCTLNSSRDTISNPTRQRGRSFGETTRDLYYSAAWQVIDEKEGGEWKARQVWSPVYVDALVLRDRDANSYSGDGLEERLYVAHDANWNVTALVNSSGAAVERIVYDPYGKPTFMDSVGADRMPNASSFDWVYLHQGLRLDSVVDLYDNRARAYSPTLMRFLQNDPIGFAAGDGNFYRYQDTNSPIGNDFTGLYDRDVHFYMTLFLGLAAGLCEPDAQEIAWAAEFTDHHRDTEPVRLGRRDPADEAIRRRFHFRARPGQRVVPGGPGAIAVITDVIINSILFGINGDTLLFGIGLHAFEDSYSHANVVVANPNGRDRTEHEWLIAARNPDYPALNPGRAMEMARAVYNYLVAWGDANGRCRDPIPFDSFRISIQNIIFSSDSERGHSDASYLWNALIYVHFRKTFDFDDVNRTMRDRVANFAGCARDVREP